MLSPDIENKILKDFLGDSDAIKFLRTNTYRYKKIRKYDGKGEYNYSYGNTKIYRNKINGNMVNFNLKKIVLWDLKSDTELEFINNVHPGIESLCIYFRSEFCDMPFRTPNLFLKLKVLILHKFTSQIGYLPENIKIFYILTNYNHPLNLPPKLKELYLGSKFNQKLELPETLRVLHLGYDYNQPLKLPSNLYQLYPGERFQHQIEYFPDSLKRLTISEDYKYPIPVDFKHISTRNYARYDCLCELEESCYKESIQYFKDHMSTEYQDCQTLEEWVTKEIEDGSYMDFDKVQSLIKKVDDITQKDKIMSIISEIASTPEHDRYGNDLHVEFYPVEDSDEYEDY